MSSGTDRVLREELVTVTNHGERIHGMLHLPSPGHDPVPGVLILHGFTGSSTSDNRLLPRQARHLARHGFAALRFDFRGSGQSEGEFAEMTLGGEIDDAALMLDWLAARPEIDAARMGVLGFSVGGSIAACLSAQRETIKALVLWAPVAQPYGLLAGIAAARGVQLAGLRDVDAEGEAVGAAFIEEIGSIQPLRALAGHGIPMRVVHGTGDTTVPISQGEAFVAAATGPHDLILLEGANHGFRALPWRERLFDATAEWFDRYLTAAR